MLFLGVAVGGCIVLWQQLRVWHTWLVPVMDHYLPRSLARTLQHDTALMYWLSLLSVVFIDPLFGQPLAWRLYFGELVSWLILVGLSTMVVSLIALATRAGIVFLHRMVSGEERR